MNNTLEAKTKEVKNYVSRYKNNLQGSEGWLIAKKYTIGGSEIASLQGKNPFQNIYQLIINKTGMNTVDCYAGNIKMQWGNLFEYVIQQYVEYDKNTTIYGTDIFIPGTTNQSYSPDGIGIVSVDLYTHIEDTITHPDGTTVTTTKTSPVTKYETVLFEFKCPFSRIPTATGPPEYYVPQVKMGLDTIPITNVGLFIQGIFRRCSFDNLIANMSFCPVENQKVPGSIRQKGPLAYGIIGFYKNKNYHPKGKIIDLDAGDEKINIIDSEIYSCLDSLFEEEGFEFNELNDLGGCSGKLFAVIMYAFDIKAVKLYYPKNIICTESDSPKHSYQNIYEHLDEFSKYPGIYGVLPWKLFRIYYDYIEKEVGYINKYKKIIDEVIEVVNKCHQASDPDEKWSIISQYMYM